LSTHSKRDGDVIKITFNEIKHSLPDHQTVGQKDPNSNFSD